MTSFSKNRSHSISSSFALALALTGCAAEADSPEDDHADALAQVVSSTRDGEAAVVSYPWGTTSYPASYPANLPRVESAELVGLGCPAGTATSAVSPDGKVITTTFTGYKAAVDKNKSTDIKTCALAITLQANTKVETAVANVRLQGYAHLAAGQDISVLDMISVQSQTSMFLDSKSTIKGPFSDSFTANHLVGEVDQLWSGCKMKPLHIVNTTVRIGNGPSKTDGYVSFSKDDRTREQENVLITTLTWRNCR